MVKTSDIQLESYLGSLDLTDENDGISPSKLSFNQIAKKIEEFDGFWYAAHVTQDNGVLENQQYPVWQSSYLKAAQIPAKRHEIEDRYKNILKEAVINTLEGGSNAFTIRNPVFTSINY